MRGALAIPAAAIPAPVQGGARKASKDRARARFDCPTSFAGYEPSWRKAFLNGLRRHGTAKTRTNQRRKLSG